MNTPNRWLALPALVSLAAAFASPTSAAPIYQESFATESTSANFAATYPGFTQSGPLWNVSASGYASTDTSGGDGRLWRTMIAYDWSVPITISAEIGSATASGGQGLGIFFSNASGPVNGAGISFRPFIRSDTNGANITDAKGDNRGTFGVASNRDINPDIPQGGALTKISLTIRENVADDTKFDWLAKVADTPVWTSVADGSDGVTGWHTGIAKSKLNAAAGLTTFGIAYDGMIPRIDNLTVTLEEPPPPQAEIFSFILGEYGPATIGALNEGASDIIIQVPHGSDVSAVAPTITFSAGASCDPASGVAQDFSSPVEYTVTNGAASNTYTVIVSFAAPEAKILTFDFGAYGPADIGPLTGGYANITLELPYGTDLSALTPTFTLSSGATCDPTSGSAQNFNGQVIYTVTSATTADYPTPTVNYYMVNATTPVLIVLEDLKHSDGANFWTPSPNNAQEHYSHLVSSTDLINQGQITLASQTGAGGGGNALASLNDGSNGTQVAGTEYLFNGYRTTESPFTVTYNLNTELNAAGYDLTEIGTSTHWGDNRAGQRFEVFVDYVSSEGTEWVSLGSFYSATPGGQGQAHFMRLGNPADDGSPFATGVAAIRFDVSTSDNWDAWYEIDVHGTATPAEAAPYDVWAAGYGLAGGPDDDDDGDGLDNFHEFAFGLDPTNGASVNPIVDNSELKDGYFKYTRLHDSGLTYTIWTSPDLENWTDVTDNVADEALAENGVETVTVDLGAPPDGDSFFVQVRAE
jgi:hypothetical protein